MIPSFLLRQVLYFILQKNERRAPGQAWILVGVVGAILAFNGSNAFEKN
jgi:hypothetical protein